MKLSYIEGTQQVYSTLNRIVVREVCEWVAIQQRLPTLNPNSLLYSPFSFDTGNGEWWKISKVYPTNFQTDCVVLALSQDGFVACMLIQIEGISTNDLYGLQGVIVIDELRGLLHSLRTAGIYIEYIYCH